MVFFSGLIPAMQVIVIHAARMSACAIVMFSPVVTCTSQPGPELHIAADQWLDNKPLSLALSRTLLSGMQSGLMQPAKKMAGIMMEYKLISWLVNISLLLDQRQRGLLQ